MSVYKNKNVFYMNLVFKLALTFLFMTRTMQGGFVVIPPNKQLMK